MKYRNLSQNHSANLANEFTLKSDCRFVEKISKSVIVFTLIMIGTCFNSVQAVSINKEIVLTPGALSTALNDVEMASVTTLKITGTMDARDFKTMRDEMPSLVRIDLSQVTITAYKGTIGTKFQDANYSANEIPPYSGYNSSKNEGNSTYSAFKLPETLISIDSLAFAYCTNLDTIYIPAKVNAIRFSAFLNCINLKSINIPSTITEISANCFENCSLLESIDLPSGITKLGPSAFKNSGIRQITLKEGLLVIEDSCFQSCHNLKQVQLPASLREIQSSAFTFLDALTEFQIPDANPNFSVQNGILYTKSKNTLVCYPGGKSINAVIPDGVLNIGEAAFKGSTKIQSIQIPSSVKTIYSEAFHSCKNLRFIEIPESVTSIGEHAFYDCISLGAVFANAATPIILSKMNEDFLNVSMEKCILFVPQGRLSAYMKAPLWNQFNHIKEFTSVIDKDGNVYHGIVIGSQKWLVENLRTKHYRNGDPIETTSDVISSQMNADYQWPCNGDESTVYQYGRLYTFGVASDARGITPVGWHIPTASDLADLQEALSIYQGSNKYIGKKMALASIEWATSETQSTIGFERERNNSSAFSAQPVGIRRHTAVYDGYNGSAWFWTSTQKVNEEAMAFNLNYADSTLLMQSCYFLNDGFSLRCVNDTLFSELNDSKEINLTAGMLSKSLTANEKIRIRNLKLTGTIDARDFKTMRDSINLLENIDLSMTSVVAYIGTEGTLKRNAKYLANLIPQSVGCELTLNNPNKTFQSIKLPESVIRIDTSAFTYCIKLRDLELPPTTTTINYNAFYLCQALENINIPMGVTSIPEMCFAYCQKLKTLKLPSTVTSINYGAFNYCTSLESINIPDKVDSISGFVFSFCDSLKNMVVPISVKSIGKYAFYRSGLSAISLPGVQTIAEGAFRECSNLKSVGLSEYASEMGHSPFSYNNALTAFNVASDNPVFSVIDGVLFNKKRTNLIYFPGGKCESYTIPVGVSVIGTDAFEGSEKITDIYIPITTHTISTEAFKDCSNLQFMDIPSTVSSLGGNAFYGCRSLTALSIQSSIPYDLKGLDNTFVNVNTSSCILFVPEGSKTKFQIADNWKDFQRIIEFTPVRDYDGNIYHSIILGSQKWLVENLRTNHYNNGDSIYTTETPSKDISNQVDPFYQWSVNGDSDNDYILGKLYTWNAATDNRGLCPEGFRVPSKEDWDKLTNYLSEKVGTNNSVAMQMASSTNFWNTSYTADVIGNEKSSNNSSGFSALPVGVRLPVGNSSDFQKTSWWWSTSEYDDEVNNGIWAFGLNYCEPNLLSQKLRYRNFGIAVRCVSDTAYISNLKFDLESKISLYPNPALNGFYIKGVNDMSSICILNMEGQLLLTTSINENGFVDISKLKPGVYLIKITSNGFFLIKKLIKK